MKSGRKPTLTFSEQVKLRTIQAVFGMGSAEEESFWEQARVAAKLRRNIRRGKSIAPKPKKYANYAEAHRAAMNEYYKRNREKILARQRERYAAAKKEKETGNVETEKE